MSHIHSLYKSITFTASGHGISVEVDEFKFAKRLENLLDIGFGKIEVERTNI